MSVNPDWLKSANPEVVESLKIWWGKFKALGLYQNLIFLDSNLGPICQCHVFPSDYSIVKDSNVDLTVGN